jgi:hypothetical protein
MLLVSPLVRIVYDPGGGAGTCPVTDPMLERVLKAR